MIRRQRWQLTTFLLACLATGIAALSFSANDATRARADEKTKAVAAKAEGGWGTLKGRFVYGGPVPQPGKIVVPNKPELAACKKHAILDESLVVNAENKGIANVFVYLRRAPAVHPELLDPPGSPAVLDQKGCTFIPHAQIVRKDQGLLVKSNDPTRHNTRTSPLANPPFNQILAPNFREGIKIEFVTGERFPFQVNCDLHTWMTAWILVLDHPYGALSDANGEFVLEKLPAGKHTFIPWQESGGYLFYKIDVAIKNGQPTKRGFLEVEIKDGQTTDLGDVVIPASKFAPN